MAEKIRATCQLTIWWTSRSVYKRVNNQRVSVMAVVSTIAQDVSVTINHIVNHDVRGCAKAQAASKAHHSNSSSGPKHEYLSWGQHPPKKQPVAWKRQHYYSRSTGESIVANVDMIVIPQLKELKNEFSQAREKVPRKQPIRNYVPPLKNNRDTKNLQYWLYACSDCPSKVKFEDKSVAKAQVQNMFGGICGIKQIDVLITEDERIFKRSLSSNYICWERMGLSTARQLAKVSLMRRLELSDIHRYSGS